MKLFLAILCIFALSSQAATTPTKAVTQETASKAVTDDIVIPNGRSLTAPTATTGTNTTQVATTAFVQAALAASGGAITNPSIAYVQSNGNDSTGTISRPDKPYQTFQAAYNAEANVFVFGVGTFAGLTASGLDIMLIGQGASKTIVGNISGTAGSIYGNGQDNITVGAISIQPIQASTGSDGNPATSTAAGDGATGTDSPNVTVQGLATTSDVILVSGNGGNGGYGGDASSGQTTLTGGNGGSAGDCGTLTVINCTLSGWAVSYSGLGGSGGNGSNSTDNSNIGGNGGNGGNGGTPGAVLVKYSTCVSFYSGPEGGGSAGSGGTGSAPGNAGNAGNSSGAGTVTTYFVKANTAPSSGETTNLYASFIGGVWTSLGPNSTGGNGSADAGLLAKYGSNGELKAQSFAANAGTYQTSIDPQNLKFFDTANTLNVTLHDALSGSFNLYLPNISADATLISTNDTGTVTNGMLAGSIAASKLVGSDITTVGTLSAGSIPTSLLTGTLAETALAFTDITTGNASTSKHGYAPKLDNNAAHYLNGQGNWTTPSGGSGTVTSVAQSFTGGLISVSGSPVTTSGTLALTVAGTSGGIPYFSSASTWASSAVLAANSLMKGGGAGVAPSTITTGTGVLTALGVNVGSSGAFVTYGGALGTPSGGTLTSCTGLPIAGITGLGAGVATALGNAVNATGGLLTYGIIGTSGAAVPLLNTACTHASGQTFGAASGDYLAIASGSTRQLRITSNAFSLGSSSWLFGQYDSGSLSPASNGQTIYFEANIAARGNMLLYSDLQWNDGTVINKMATDKLMLRDYLTTTNACSFLVANTYTSSTNYEAGIMDWKGTANVLRIGSSVGSGGGTARDVQLVRGDTTHVTLGANTDTHAFPVKLPSYTVSGLPSASTCGAGSCAFVTDATLTTSYTTVIGGGSNKVLVISDGTNWIIH
jgi:hypothetical protein